MKCKDLSEMCIFFIVGKINSANEHVVVVTFVMRSHSCKLQKTLLYLGLRVVW